MGTAEPLTYAASDSSSRPPPCPWPLPCEALVQTSENSGDSRPFLDMRGKAPAFDDCCCHQKQRVLLRKDRTPTSFLLEFKELDFVAVHAD